MTPGGLARLTELPLAFQPGEGWRYHHQTDSWRLVAERGVWPVGHLHRPVALTVILIAEAPLALMFHALPQAGRRAGSACGTTFSIGMCDAALKPWQERGYGYTFAASGGYHGDLLGTTLQRSGQPGRRQRRHRPEDVGGRMDGQAVEIVGAIAYNRRNDTALEARDRHLGCARAS